MCKEEVLLLFEQIQDSLETIITRAIPVNTAEDFTHSADGMMRLDSICMLLVTIGEAIKNIDKYTHKSLLPKYPEINWRNVMGLRDIIAHQYFNVDAEIILRIVKINIPQLQNVIKQIIIELRKEALEDI
ncbi:HepT-like ribonuclease domain-containing protein [Parabacteroides sp.]